MPTSTNSQTNSNGVTNRACGQITTTSASAAALAIQLGFVPRVFMFINATDRIQDNWYEGMASASSIHTVANGTVTLELTNGIAVDSTLKTVTLTATTMVASKVFYWVAEG